MRFHFEEIGFEYGEDLAEIFLALFHVTIDLRLGYLHVRLHTTIISWALKTATVKHEGVLSFCGDFCQVYRSQKL